MTDSEAPAETQGAQLPQAEAPDAGSQDARLVRELADVLNDTALTEIEYERGDLKIRVSRTVVAAAPAAPAAPPPVHYAGAPASPAAVEAPPPAAPARPAGDMVKSPMVGTIYLQSQPGAPPFVKIGDRVATGQTLMLVEAMKTMNPIVAPKDGVLVDMLVADGQPVEYGEPLAIIG